MDKGSFPLLLPVVVARARYQLTASSSWMAVCLISFGSVGVSSGATLTGLSTVNRRWYRASGGCWSVTGGLLQCPVNDQNEGGGNATVLGRTNTKQVAGSMIDPNGVFELYCFSDYIDSST